MEKGLHIWCGCDVMVGVVVLGCGRAPEYCRICYVILWCMCAKITSVDRGVCVTIDVVKMYIMFERLSG
jgi:hypothetical protein